MEPVVLEPRLGNVLAGNNPGHAVISIQHDQVPQTHRAEKPTIQRNTGRSIPSKHLGTKTKLKKDKLVREK